MKLLLKGLEMYSEFQSSNSNKSSKQIIVCTKFNGVRRNFSATASSYAPWKSFIKITIPSSHAKFHLYMYRGITSRPLK